jgi:hypothetical protein
MNDPAPETATPQSMEEILREVRRIIAENDIEKLRRAREVPEAAQESAAAVIERLPGASPSRAERTFDPGELRRSRVERPHIETFMEGYAQPTVRGDRSKKSHRPSAPILMILGFIVAGVAAAMMIVGGVSIVGVGQFIQLRSIFGGFLMGAGLQACMLVLRVARERIADLDEDAASKRTVMDLPSF